MFVGFSEIIKNVFVKHMQHVGYSGRIEQNTEIGKTI